MYQGRSLRWHSHRSPWHSPNYYFFDKGLLASGFIRAFCKLERLKSCSFIGVLPSSLRKFKLIESESEYSKSLSSWIVVTDCLSFFPCFFFGWVVTSTFFDFVGFWFFGFTILVRFFWVFFLVIDLFLVDFLFFLYCFFRVHLVHRFRCCCHVSLFRCWTMNQTSLIHSFWNIMLMKLGSLK